MELFQAPVCTTSLHEKCGTVCETVDEVVSSPVESIVCVQKMEAVCREVFAELCVVPEVEQQFCPVIHALEGQDIISFEIGTPQHLNPQDIFQSR